MTKQKRIQARLALNRHERTPFITFDMPIDPLANRSHCTLIAQQMDEFGCVWERCEATPHLSAALPDEPGLYMFVWLPSMYIMLDGKRESLRQQFPMVLYVGQVGAEFSSENTIRERYVGEYAKLVSVDADALWAKAGARERRRSRLMRHLAVDPLQFWFTTIKDRVRIRLLERRLIEMFNPPACLQLKARLRQDRESSTPLADQEILGHG